MLLTDGELIIVVNLKVVERNRVNENGGRGVGSKGTWDR